MKLTNRALTFVLCMALLGIATITAASSDSNGVIRLSGDGDTVAASPTPYNPARYISTVRMYSSAGVKHFTLRAGTSVSGAILFKGYCYKDDSATLFASALDQYLTVPVDGIKVPNEGLYLETDSNSTSGALYLYTRPSGTK